MPLTNHMKHAKAKSLNAKSFLAAGMMVSASVLVAPAARADDSLWGKAISSIGLGGNSQSAPASAPPQAAPAPQPNVPAPQPKQNVTSSNAAPPAARESISQVAPDQSSAPAQGPNLLTNWFGWGRGAESASQGAATQQANAVAPTQRAISPTQAVTPPPPPPPPRAEPSMWDRMLGSTGGGSPDAINYNERPKLAVPKERALPPPPQVAGEPPPTRAANGDYLVKPPETYLEKVRGPDGVASGLRDSDLAKDKKFFGLF
jgi:hypothetical protein